MDDIECTRPIPCGHDDIELHILTGRADLDACLWAVKSFLAHSERRMPVVVHSDGSIQQAEAARLRRHLPGCAIVDRSRARREVAAFLEASYPSLYHYRCTREQLMFYKLIDFYVFSRSKRVLAIDTDILWLKAPTQLNRFLDSGTGFFMNGARSAYGFDMDALKRYYGIRMRPRINAGLIHVPGHEAFNLDLLEYAASLAIKHAQDHKLGGGGWLEQTLYAILFSVEQERYARLDPREYVIPAADATGDEDVTAVHCVTPRRALFPVYAQKVRQREAFQALC